MIDAHHYIGDALSWYNRDIPRLFNEKGPDYVTTDGAVYFRQSTSRWVFRQHGASCITPGGHVEYTDKRGSAHRTDGPAKIWEDGSKEYWVDGIRLPEDEFFLTYGVM